VIQLRQAQESDQRKIRALINQVKINPMDLDWSRFILATTDGDELAGCGQVKRHRDGSLELASIAVEPAWRGQGIARMIIERLISDHPGELYLVCRSRLGVFYDRFGFRSIQENDMPPYFRRIHRLVRVFGRTGLMPMDLLVMKRDGSSMREG
jgi:N-acetylglutamate synthase-like GNAT family acetyltransferase